MSDETPNQEVKRGDFARKKGEVILREHEYDGIQEFDQKLPNWWLFTFYFAVVWFVVYWVLYYNTSAYQTDQDKIQTKMAEVYQQKKEALEASLNATSDKVIIEEWAKDSARVESGKTVYMGACIACHGIELDATLSGNPLPGRSLVDGEWQYGKSPKAIFTMINEGTPAGAAGYNGVPMVAKGGAQLTNEQIFEITAFLVASNPDDFADATFDDDGMLIEE